MGLLSRLTSKKNYREIEASGRANYAYTTTRVRAMKSKLIPSNTYQQLMNMGVDQITRFIGELEYKGDVDELAMRYQGIDLIEHALNRNLAVTYNKLLRISEGEINHLISIYLEKYDVWNIKTILRGKYSKASNEEILSSIIAAGKLPYTFLSELISKSSIDDIINSLSHTPYYSILKEYNGNNLSTVEDKIDKKYYEDLFSYVISQKSEDTKLFSNFIMTEIDVKNLSTLIRLRKYGLTDPIMQNLFIDGGLKFKLKDLENMLSMSQEDLNNELSKHSNWSELIEHTDSEIKSLAGFEGVLKKITLKSALTLSHANPLSIIPIMDFIVSKQNEVNNLRLIIRGKALNLTDDEIKSQLVI